MAGKNKKRRQRRGNGPRPSRAGARAEAKQSAVSPGRAGSGTSSRRRPDEGRPPAPWGRFPLVELMVLLGIVLLIWGLISQRPMTIMVGLGVASLAGLELSVREHFSGFRSHTVLLAGAAALLTVVLTSTFTQLILAICLGLGAAVFGAGFFGLRRAFRQASGGYNFRIGGFRG